MAINKGLKGISVKGSYPYVLQVQGNVPDKRLDESLLQPELFFSLVKGIIFNLKDRGDQICLSHHQSGGLS